MLTTILLLGMLWQSGTAIASPDNFLVVSARPFEIKSKERIVGFQVNVRSGRIVTLSSIPIGWNVTIDNDPSWRTSASGAIIVGAAALDPDYFQDFLVIEKDESLGFKLDVTLEIDLSLDFQKVRKVKLELPDLILKPRSRK